MLDERRREAFLQREMELELEFREKIAKTSSVESAEKVLSQVRAGWTVAWAEVCPLTCMCT